MNSKQIVSRKHLKKQNKHKNASVSRSRPLYVYLEVEVFSRYELFTIHYFLSSYKKHFSKNIHVYVKTG